MARLLVLSYTAHRRLLRFSEFENLGTVELGVSGGDLLRLEG